jgi:hypothetical protein
MRLLLGGETVTPESRVVPAELEQEWEGGCSLPEDVSIPLLP